MAEDQRVMNQGDVGTYEERLTTIAGSTDFLATKGPIRDAAGQPYALFGVARDITKSKQVDEALRASEQKFSNIFRMSPDPIDVTELETGVMLDCNPSTPGCSATPGTRSSGAPASPGPWAWGGRPGTGPAPGGAEGARASPWVSRRSCGARTAGSLWPRSPRPSWKSGANRATCPWPGTSPPRNGRRRPCGKATGAWNWPRPGRPAWASGTATWRTAPTCGANGCTSSTAWSATRTSAPTSIPGAGTSCTRRTGRGSGARARPPSTAGRTYRLEFRVIRRDGRVRHLRVRRPGAAGRPGPAGADHRHRPGPHPGGGGGSRAAAAAGGAAARPEDGKPGQPGRRRGPRHEQCAGGHPGHGLALRRRRRRGAGPRPWTPSSSACTRGRDVVRSLLCFARKDLEDRARWTSTAWSGRWSQLLELHHPEAVRPGSTCRRPGRRSKGDPGALSHALMNLCVNAVDAMPGGGTLTLRTRHLAGGRSRCAVRGHRPGHDPGGAAPGHGALLHHQGRWARAPAWAWPWSTARSRPTGAPWSPERAGPGHPGEPRLPAPGRPGGRPGAGPAPAGPRRPLRILLVDDDELIR